MKRITLTAAEYGLTFGINRAIRDLAAGGILSAVGCLTVSDLWSREFLPLRDAVDEAGHATMVGVMVALTQPWRPVSIHGQRYFPDGFPKRRWYGRRNFLRLLPDETLYAEISAQLDRFEEYYGRPADFVAVADDLLNLRQVAQTMIKVAESRRKRPQIVNPFLEDRPAARFRKRFEKHGISTLPRGRDLPLTADREKLSAHVWRGFDGLSDQAVAFCFPAEADDRLRRMEPAATIEARRLQRAFLASDQFNILLLNKDIFLF